jgi:hypothetical protein
MLWIVFFSYHIDGSRKAPTTALAQNERKTFCIIFFIMSKERFGQLTSLSPPAILDLSAEPDLNE